MRSFAITVLLALFACWSSAVASPDLTVDGYLKAMVSMTQSKCESNRGKPDKYDKPGMELQAYAMKSATRLMCECMPSQVAKLRATLPRKELDVTYLDPNAFTRKYMPLIMGSCASAGLRATYSEADGCAARYARIKTHSASYCTCMSEYTKAMSDPDVVQMGLESEDYVPRAADAKKQGLPAPETPPLLKRMMAADVACSRK